MFDHVSLDIETLSTHKNAVVLSIGACTVTPDVIGEATFYHDLEIQPQIDMGRHISADTLSWWMGQTEDAKDSAFEGQTVTPLQAISVLRIWLATLGGPRVWTKGPAFDGAILESLAEQLNSLPCWKYRQHRDVRTIEDALEARGRRDSKFGLRFYEMKSNALDGLTAHNALDDAIAQGKVVQMALQESLV